MLFLGSQSPPSLPPVSPTALHAYAELYACNHQSPPSTQSSGELSNAEDCASWDLLSSLGGTSDQDTDEGAGSEAGDIPTFDEVVAQAMHENRITPARKPQYDKLQQQLEVLLKRATARHTITTNMVDDHGVVQCVEGGYRDEAVWHSVAGECIGTSDKTCLQYCYGLQYIKRRSHMCNADLQAIMSFFGEFIHKDNAPDNPDNRIPPSLYASNRILQVPAAEKYEFHVCTGAGCFHFWRFMPKPQKRVRMCEGCEQCMCPVCGMSRYKQNGDDRG
jgi:hypothetical protein